MKIDMSKSKEIFGEEAQLAALSESVHNLALIANPSKRVIAAALAKHPKAAEYVKASWPAT